jgi:selenocysteine lyase/cysteine desulfurase
MVVVVAQRDAGLAHFRTSTVERCTEGRNFFQGLGQGVREGIPGVLNAEGLAALDGLRDIEAHIGEITGAIKEGAMRRGFNLVSPVDPRRHGAMITIRSHKVDLLVKRLKEGGVIVSSRDDNLRISPHFYNNLSDVNHLMDCLTEHRELLV